MNDAELKRIVDRYVDGDISPEEHQALQQKLKSDPQARAVFCECVDLDASLRTWAAEGATATWQRPGPDAPVRRESGLSRRWYAILAIAASVALIALSGWLWQQVSERSQEQIAEQPRDAVDTLTHLGTISQQEACVWTPSRTLSTGSRFSVGSLLLVSGIAELNFDSGTNVVMQGPCELQVASADSAQLLAGNVVVHVTELSDGFTLKTPDAAIIDEGTEYAVSLDDQATEVHVFDGSVFWEPVTDADDANLERIEAGEARRYLRSNPASGARIPLAMRKFVRRIEADVRESAGAGLLAYDGFENLAGRIRRGRSGFGWSGGWLPSLRGRGSIGAIVDAPDDIVFGVSRSDRRLLQLTRGEAIQRDLEQALPMQLGETYYLSFLVQRNRGESESSRFLQVSMSGGDLHPRRRSRSELAFGITSDGFPYIKTDGRIIQSAPSIEDKSVYLFVGKIVVTSESSAATYLRVYHAGETIDGREPTAWTAVGQSSPSEFALSRIRLAAGANALFDIDELKLGTTWHAVTVGAPD
jgi:ferric-dicitrate binding protein FerR (iron transport regulator)